MANALLKDFAPIEGVHFLGGKTLRGDILNRAPLSCASCEAPEGKHRCASCFSYAYCSKDVRTLQYDACQVKHWPQHKISCKGIKAFLDLEATVMALCGSPFILHHLRAGIAIALDLVDPDHDSEESKNQKHECRVVPIKLTIHPLSEADTLAFALGKRTIQGKGQDSRVPGFVALHTMETDELVRSVDRIDAPNTEDGKDDNLKGKDLESEEPRVKMTGSKSTEVDRLDQKRYRALWKQVRDQRAAERAARPTPSEQLKQGETVSKYDILYEFDPDPVVLVDFEYENDRCTVALEITPDALETALCEKLSDGDEKLLEQMGVDLPEEWELFDMIVMINAYILADTEDKLKLRRILKRSDAKFLQEYMFTTAGK